MRESIKNIDKLVQSKYLLKTNDFLVFKLCADGLYRVNGSDERKFQYDSYTFATLVDRFKFLPIAPEDIPYYDNLRDNLLMNTVVDIEVVEEEETEPDIIEDNELIIKYLNGDNNAIGKLFLKYQSKHKLNLSHHIRRNSLKLKLYKKTKESAFTIDDIIIESQIKIMSKIKSGRFGGDNFLAWSDKLIQKYYTQYIENELEKKKYLRDKTESAVGY